LSDPTNPTPVSPSPESQSAAAAPEASAAAASQALSRPEGLPDRFWDDKAGVKVEDLAKFAIETEAAAAKRGETVPKEAAGYKPEIAAVADIATKYGLKPEDVAVAEDHPLIQPFRELALKSGMGQEQFSEALGLFVDYQLSAQKGEMAKLETAIAEEKKKLGDADGRVGGVMTFLKAHVGEDGAKALAPMLYTAQQVETFEKLQKALSTQGGRTAPAGGGAPSDPKTLTDEERSRMTPAERLHFARTGQRAA
jgi:hypothetical protein